MGQIVLIGDDNVSTAKWPIGIVLEIFSGPDNIVRVATVKTNTGEYKRNVRLLAPLPLHHDNESEIQVDKDATALPEEISMRTQDCREEADPPPRATGSSWGGRLRPKAGRKWSWLKRNR